MTSDNDMSGPYGQNPESRPEPRTSRAPGGHLVSLNDEVDLSPGEPVPDYDMGPVKAYRAYSKDRGTGQYIAFIGEAALVPRHRRVSAYGAMNSPVLAPLVASGICFWPPVQQERCVFVYRDVFGKRIHKPGDPEALGWKQDPVMEAVVRPMVDTLKEFYERNFFHGAIRASNMFAQMAGGKIERVVLGDCLALPPSYLQPTLYEPIERACALPVARGEGFPADDMYAFGVALAVLLRVNDPLEGKTDEEILREKMEVGSYFAVTGKDRFKGSILELLRGLLQDDQTQRWTLEEVQAWLDGRRLSPKQGIRLKKAARPLLWNGQKYLYTNFLALDFGRAPAETVTVIESGEFEQWLERSLEDDDALERTQNAVRVAKERGVGPGYDERLCAHLSIALDPHAPLRYRRLAMLGTGVGTALAAAIVGRKDLNPFVEMFNQGIAMAWITASPQFSMDGLLISRFDQCRAHLRQPKVGSGIERCIYILADECHCLSEKLTDYYVTSPEQMMMAFEKICERGKAPRLFLDRHSIAFLSVKDPKVVDSHLYELGSNEEHRRVMGNLKCLAALQKRLPGRRFPGVARVLSEALESVYARYHDREIREQLKSLVNKFAVEGDVAKMAMALDNPEVIGKDATGFRRAMMEYAELNFEYRKLVMSMESRKIFGQSTGKAFSAFVSSIIASIIILITAFIYLFSHTATF